MVSIKRLQSKGRTKLKQIYRVISVEQDPQAILPISWSKPLLQRLLILLVLGTMLLSCSKDFGSTNTSNPSPAKNYTYEIVNTYPHDPDAFTQGLVYYDDNLYEGTGITGESTLRFVDLETGTVLRKRDIGQSPTGNYFGEGVTIFRDTVYQLTWQAQVGFKYNKNTFDSLGEFNYSTQGWGLTHNGANLIMSDGTHSVFFLDPSDFRVVKIIEVTDTAGPVVRLNELEYINGEIYANVWLTKKIARISPATGNVTGWIDLTELVYLVDSLSIPDIDVLNGIAYDEANDRLFVTGKYWPSLFEINLIEID